MKKQLAASALALLGLAAAQAPASAAHVVHGKVHFSFVVPSFKFGFGGGCDNDCHPCHHAMPGVVPGPWYIYFPTQHGHPYWGHAYSTGPSSPVGYPPYYYQGMRAPAPQPQALAAPPQAAPAPLPTAAYPQNPYYFTGSQGVPVYWHGR